MFQEKLPLIIFPFLLMLAACVSTSDAKFSPELEDGINKATYEIGYCIGEREKGIYKTYKDTALCGNKAIKKYVMPHAKFPSLVNEFMAYRLAIAEQTDAGKYDYDTAHDLILAKREALTQRGLKMREDLSKQAWVNDNQNPFKSVGCKFRLDGTAKCADW